MKSLVILFHFCFALLLNGKELTEEETTAVKKEITEMVTKFNAGDHSDIILKTHPSLIKLMGGKDKLVAAMDTVIEMIKTEKIKMGKLELGGATQLYPAGDEEVTFIKKVTFMTIGEKHLKSTNFMIAIRTIGTNKWSFLDGSGLENNKALLWQLLPKLTKELVLPENKTELIPAK